MTIFGIQLSKKLLTVIGAVLLIIMADQRILNLSPSSREQIELFVVVYVIGQSSIDLVSHGIREYQLGKSIAAAKADYKLSPSTTIGWETLTPPPSTLDSNVRIQGRTSEGVKTDLTVDEVVELLVKANLVVKKEEEKSETT